MQRQGTNLNASTRRSGKSKIAAAFRARPLFLAPRGQKVKRRLSEFPFTFGGCVGAIAVAAAGGALGLAIAAAIAGGAAGAGLGTLLAAAIAHLHSAGVQLKKGGLVLWVSVSYPDAEKRALTVLSEMGGRDVHVHKIQREWSLREIPFAESQPDPFLENDK